jgi:hypothetical protein
MDHVLLVLIFAFTAFSHNSNVRVAFHINTFTFSGNNDNLGLLWAGVMRVGGVGAFFVISTVALDVAIGDDTESVNNT